MPPRRPLTDLCLISVFKQLTPNNQLKASRMSPRCLLLVRAANRRCLKSLVIKSRRNSCEFEDYFKFLYSSKHCMQLIEGSVPFVRYLLNSRFSKWNCLLLWDAFEDEWDNCHSHNCQSDIVDQIVYLFSSVTDLKFQVDGSSWDCEVLTKLLQHPHWAGQLTDLMLQGEDVDKDYDFSLTHDVNAALNGLSALQLLSVKRFINLNISKLTILAQLKVITVYYGPLDSPLEDSILRFFENQSSNVTQTQQQVHLFWYDNWWDSYSFSDLLELLSKLEGNRIVGFQCFPYNSERRDTMIRLLSKLTSLVSLAIDIVVTPKESLQTIVVPLFTALSQLKQLLYLKLWAHINIKKETLLPQPLSVQLSSVRALHLDLNISSHAQVMWLNLTQTLPNCQAIDLTSYSCSACSVSTDKFTEGLADYVDNSLSCGGAAYRSVALYCLRRTLTELHQGVQSSRLIFTYGWHVRESSLEQLLQLLKSSTTQQ